MPLFLSRLRKRLTVQLLAFALLVGITTTVAALEISRYVPLQAGNQWAYRNNVATQSQTVGSPVVLPGGISAIPWTSIDSRIPGYTVTYSTVDGNGFRRYQEFVSSVFISGYGNTSATSTYSPALVIAPANVTPGSIYTSNGTMTITYTYVTTITLSYSASTQVVGFELVTNYDRTKSWSALKTIITLTASGTINGAFNTITTATTVWLVDGLGAVQTFKPNTSQVMELWQLTSTNVAPPKTAQTISFGGAPSVIVGGTGTASATATSGLAVTIGTNSAGICTVSGNTVTGISAGTCTITANQAGNDTYLAAAQATQAITISQPVTYSYSACLNCHTTVRAQTHVGANANSCAVCHALGKTIDYLTAHNNLAAASKVVTCVSGWNLVGNSVEAPINVATTFSDASKVNSVWKWISSSAKWAFYTPTQADGGAAYAATKGYDLLKAINGGEAFWVNALTAFTAPLPSGTAITSTSFQTLPSGWSLISIGSSRTPAGFNADLSVSPLVAGVVPRNITSLWAWDNAQLKWYFYGSSLEAQGGTALTDYISSKGYLDFTTANKTLGPGVGFWVNRP